MAIKINYYEVMGVSPSASPADIKARYRELTKKYHPDLPENGPAEAEIMVNINVAYDVLNDAEKRAKHDKELGVISGVGYTNRGPIVTNATLAKAGAPARASVRISFEESYTGCEKDVEYASTKRCPDCGGNAYTSGAFGNKILCHRCSGKGVIDRKAKHSVKLRAGVVDGETLTIRGAGGEAPSEGNPNGDLFVQVAVEPSDKFSRVGDDLVSSETMSLETALLGGKLEIDSIGKKQVIQVTPNAKTVRKLVCDGGGFPKKDGTRGCHRIEVKVVLPVLKTAEQRRAFSEFVKTLSTGSTMSELKF